MNRKIVVLLGIVLSLAVMLVGCTNGQVEDDKINNGETTTSDTNLSDEIENDSSENEEQTNVNADLDNNNVNGEKSNPIATMTMENGDIVKIELYPDIAPETVNNFITLANSGFYDGLIFHRVIPDFMAQGGDPDGNGTGGPGYSIKGEFKLNGVENNLKHEIGIVSMARSEDYDTAGSQFFIVTSEKYSEQALDGQYAGFGKVIEGMEHVYTIVNSEVIRRAVDEELATQVYTEYYTTGKVDEEIYAEYYKQSMEVDRPINPPVIKSITVETFGVEYGEPTKY